MMLLLGLAHAGLFKKAEPPPAELPVAPHSAPMHVAPFVPAPGSLWDPTMSVQQAGLNGSAKQIGDLVTVLIEEEAASKQNASTATTSDGNSSFGVSALLGAETSIPGANPNMGGKISVGGTRTMSHSGTGAVERGGMLEATLACHVVALLPNGNLMIAGRKQVRVGGGTQYLTLRGIIRARDINVHNEVSSTLLAEAIIEYDDSGAPFSGQNPGWGSVLTNAIWPF